MSGPTSHEQGTDATVAADVRQQIRQLLREGRRAKGLTQARLAQLVDTSRFTINRLEVGGLELTLPLAERIQTALELPELTSLVARREQIPAAPEVDRDRTVRTMLGRPALEKVTIVAADDLDIYTIIFDERRDAPLKARDIRIVFPSVEREKQLFGGGRPLYGWIEYQIKRLADLQAAERYPANTLRLYESDHVLTSCVITSTRTGTECAFWSPVPADGTVRGAGLPVATSGDPATTGRLKSYADGLMRSLEPIRTNKALCRVPRVARSTEVTAEATFTRYFGQGVDQEEEVGDDEGFAVALVLTIALCTRGHHGVGRRVVTYERPTSTRDRGRLSLFSDNVDDVDIRAARALSRQMSPDTARSTRGALAAALDINEFITSCSGVIPDLAFQRAAHREFSIFDLDIAPERLERIPLPPELQLIRKGTEDGRRRAAVAPRLFLLELETGARPELDALRFAADIEELGTKDLAESDRLNDFFLVARKTGFLAPLLEELKVVEQ
jgi:DNA-binding XRE family transcriptional regulator